MLNIAYIGTKSVEIKEVEKNKNFLNIIPYEQRPAFADFEQLIYTDEKIRVYMAFWRKPGFPINAIASKMAVDCDVIEPPPILDDSEPEFDITSYHKVFPSHALIYALQGPNLISLTRHILRHIWPRLFRCNTLYEILLNRYTSSLQPLLEYHQSCTKSKKFMEILQQKFYKRVTAHTYVLAGANLLFVSLIINFGWKSVRTPNLQLSN